MTRYSNDPEFRWVYGQLKRETEKAMLVSFDNDHTEEWFPKSQVKDLGGGKFLAPTWLLEKSGLMIYSEPVEHD